MSVYAGPNATSSGLVVYIDPSNPISRFGYEPSEEKKLEKLNYYKEL